MSVQAAMELTCDCERDKHRESPGEVCGVAITDYASRGWKIRLIGARHGWRTRQVVGPRGGQRQKDYCPECTQACGQNPESWAREGDTAADAPNQTMGETK